ncbi:MAG: hypothetical protein RL701_444 [Pseudomonadota bacterium]
MVRALRCLSWVVAASASLSITACPPPPEGCTEGIASEMCIKHCATFATCAECAAQESCGWCGEGSGSSGRCIPAYNGADRRDQRPDAHCQARWFYVPGDLSVADAGAPYCPFLPAPAEAETSGGPR